jgi:hypothetical protein
MAAEEEECLTNLFIDYRNALKSMLSLFEQPQEYHSACADD